MLSHLKRDVSTFFANLLFRLPFLALLSMAMLAMALTATASGPLNSGYNPDQPRFSNIDESTYLQLRDEHIALLRGMPLPEPDVRVRAIQQYQQQQRQRRPQLPSINPAWTPLGPAPLPNGQTQQFPAVVVPVTGRATAIAVDPTNANKVYLGTAQGGVWRSLDGGVTWASIFDTGASLSIGAIALAPSDTTKLYVGTGEPNNSGDSFFGVGLYRIDNADTAANLDGPINPPFPFFTGAVTVTTTVFGGRAISAIAVHPTDPATIFVSTATGVGGVGANALSNTVPPLGLRGVYRSTNATAPAGTVAFKKLVVNTDGSLDSPGTGNTSISDMLMEPGNPNILLVTPSGAVTGGGVWRSTNALAATPTFVNTLFPGFNGLWHRLAISKVGSDVTVYVSSNEPSGLAACSSIGQAGRVRRSNNGGVTWSAPLVAAEGFCGGQCAYDNPIGADPNITTTVYLGGNARGTCQDALKKSSDGGATFTRDDTGLHADFHSIAFTSGISPSIVYVANDGGVWKRDASLGPASPWTNLNNTALNTIQFQSLAVHPTDRNFTIGGTQDNGTEGQTISPGNWLSAESGDGGFALIDQSASNTVNVTMYHTFFNQTNNLIGFDRTNLGACLAVKDSWAWRGAGVAADPTPSCDGTAFAANNGINVADTVNFYAPMALGPGTPNTLYFGTNKLYRSIDKGDTMVIASQNPIVAAVAVSAIGISPQDDSYRIVGLRNGNVWGTSIGSTTLVNLNFPFPTNATASATNHYVARTVFDPNNTDVAYVTLSYYTNPSNAGHVWKISNFGNASNAAPVAAVWTAVSNGLPNIPINAFAVDPTNSNMLFAGTDIGVYFSPDAGANWYPYGTGLPVVAVFDMAIQNSFRVLRIATHGRGMWETSMPNVPTAVTVDSLSAHAQSGGASVFQLGETLSLLFVGAGALALLALGALALQRTRRAVK